MGMFTNLFKKDHNPYTLGEHWYKIHLDYDELTGQTINYNKSDDIFSRLKDRFGNASIIASGANNTYLYIPVMDQVEGNDPADYRKKDLYIAPIGCVCIQRKTSGSTNQTAFVGNLVQSTRNITVLVSRDNEVDVYLNLIILKEF